MYTGTSKGENRKEKEKENTITAKFRKVRLNMSIG